MESISLQSREPRSHEVVDLRRDASIFDAMQAAAVPNPPARSVRLVLDVPVLEDEWVLSEENMPESSLHRDTVRLLELILLAFVARARRNARVAANLACRWNVDRRSVGVDPDVALIEPAPPESDRLKSLRTWEEGHVPPHFAIEVVSENNAKKDYEDAPAKYACLGTRELVVFDPEGLGPDFLGGPHVLQVWRRDEAGLTMTRVHAGEGPARSEELGAWLVVTSAGPAGYRLRIADDAEGGSLWLTAEEEQAAGRRKAEDASKQAEDALRSAIEGLCEAYRVPIHDARRARLLALDGAGLQALVTGLKRDRAWPG